MGGGLVHGLHGALRSVRVSIVVSCEVQMGQPLRFSDRVYVGRVKILQWAASYRGDRRGSEAQKNQLSVDVIIGKLTAARLAGGDLWWRAHKGEKRRRPTFEATDILPPSFRLLQRRCLGGRQSKEDRIWGHGEEVGEQGVRLAGHVTAGRVTYGIGLTEIY
jgi:hypothetical protein